jgi:aryl-alcohol dehydrogenase-like predicted oxidoreductase
MASRFANEIGRSGVRVSTVGLGGYWLGGDNPRAAADVLGASYDAGVDWVDTAEAYFDGANESNIGAALHAAPQMKVASKIWPRRTVADAAGVRRACEASLKRLRRDTLDIYFVHEPAADTPLGETWTAMAQLVEDGLVRAVGLSNYEIAEVRRAHALRPVDVVQDGLSLVDNLAAREHFASCADLGIAGVVYEPLGSGLLTGGYSLESDVNHLEQWPAMFERLFSRGRFARSLEVVERVRELATEWGVALPQVAIAWCAHQSGVTSVLTGTTSVTHARTNAAAAEIALSADQLASLDALIPLGPAFLDSGLEA